MKSIQTFINAKNWLNSVFKYGNAINNQSPQYVRHYSNSENNATTVIQSQVDVMANIKDEWWSMEGPARGLHYYNDLRIPFVRDGLLDSLKINVDKNSKRPLSGLKILDIGCGGGIFTEGLAKLGANIDGVDASDELLQVAKNHAALDPELNENLRYVHSTIEEFCIPNKEVYDSVVVSEVIEHIENKGLFLEGCISSLKPGGSIFFTTFNRTFLSWFVGIIMAEKVLNFIPKGTHEWDLFISPEDLSKLLNFHDCRTTIVKGINYNPLNDCRFYWASTTQVAYALQAIKKK